MFISHFRFNLVPHYLLVNVKVKLQQLCLMAVEIMSSPVQCRLPIWLLPVL